MQDYGIRRFGAVGDGQTVNTAAVQGAIDRCHADGGGTVTVAQGRYVTGTIHLKGIGIAGAGTIDGQGDWTNFPNADDPQRISDCTFCSKWAGIRTGLLSRGDFENVTVSNCVFRDIDDSGLKIQRCEGAAMRRMVFANLVMASVPRPVFMTFCQQRAGAETRISACAHGR